MREILRAQSPTLIPVGERTDGKAILARRREDMPRRGVAC
jgi:hypothetical protein